MSRASLSQSIEQLWLSWLNTNWWRQFAKHGLGSKIRRNDMFVKLDTTRRYITSGLASQRHPAQLDALTTFCIFIGHTKSGGSLIGSLLDAHPNSILAMKRMFSIMYRMALASDRFVTSLSKHHDEMRGKGASRHGEYKHTRYMCQANGKAGITNCK